MVDMDIEATREEYNRVLNNLARMMPDDPNYAKTLEAATEIAKIIGEYERRDLDRINNNIRNDIQEEGLRVDIAKVKSDRLRSWTEVIKTAMSSAVAVSMGILAYKNEAVDFKLPSARSVWNLATSWIPKR